MYYCIIYIIVICNKLQRVQNWAVRVIMGGKKYDHMSPVLKELHWLPVVKRIQFKIILLCYHSLNGSVPQYLTFLLSPHKSSLSLRSSRDVLKLHVPCSKRLWDDLAFCIAAPPLWNNLPFKIRAAPSVNIFKSIKTHLFLQ